MSDGTASSNPDPDSGASVAPSRDDVMPDSYAVRVCDAHIDVWQYRVTLSEPGGEWDVVETLARRGQ